MKHMAIGAGPAAMGRIGAFFTNGFDLKLPSIVGVGPCAGIHVGDIPGLPVTMAVSIPISLTFAWEGYPLARKGEASGRTTASPSSRRWLPMRRAATMPMR